MTHTPLFYELFFGFCNLPIPDGRRYERWRKRMDARMRTGREISHLGPWDLPEPAPVCAEVPDGRAGGAADPVPSGNPLAITK